MTSNEESNNEATIQMNEEQDDDNEIIPPSKGMSALTLGTSPCGPWAAPQIVILSCPCANTPVADSRQRNPGEIRPTPGTHCARARSPRLKQSGNCSDSWNSQMTHRWSKW